MEQWIDEGSQILLNCCYCKQEQQMSMKTMNPCFCDGVTFGIVDNQRAEVGVATSATCGL